MFNIIIFSIFILKILLVIRLYRSCRILFCNKKYSDVLLYCILEVSWLCLLKMFYVEGKLIMSLSFKKLDLDIVNFEVFIKLMIVNKEKKN